MGHGFSRRQAGVPAPQGGELGFTGERIQDSTIPQFWRKRDRWIFNGF